MRNKQKNRHAQAQALFNDGRMIEALAAYRKLCKRDDRDIQAWHMAGAIAGLTGDYGSAKSCCEKVIALNPRNHGPYLNLANILMSTGQFPEALQRYQQALQLKPDDPQTLTNLANLYAQQGMAERAERSLQRAIRSDPDHAEAYNNLGNIYREKARLTEAEQCFRKALNIKPGYVDALCNLGAVYSDQLKYAEAENCYSQAIRYAPDSPAPLRSLGDLFQSTGEFDQAKECYESALRLSPTDTHARASLATLQERCGNMEAALALLTPLIKSRRYNTRSALTYAKLCSKQDQDKAGIQLLSDTLKMPVSQDDSIELHFALGELYDHSGQYDQAFHHFKTANDMDATRRPLHNHTLDIQKTVEFFSAERLDRLPKSTNDSELPIFIVGMPRTGTSLVEQILASHSLVYAGGEREDISTIIDSLNSRMLQGEQFPHALESISQESLDRISANYLQQISSLCHAGIRFTDKTPLNGLQLGFISRLLPECRIILCKRDALDTCLSIYFHRFNALHGYAYRLDSLGEFFRQYYRLMDHWIKVLDIDILPVQYEELVRDPEPNIRTIVDFCKLDWDSSCLSFHKNKRTINTPSYDQVRKPMYTGSVGRWRHYDEHLGPLKAAING